MKYLLQFLKWLFTFLPRIRKNIKDTNIPKQKVVDSQDIFTCTFCTEPLNNGNIYRFKDQSFCIDCRDDIDSSSDSDKE